MKFILSVILIALLSFAACTVFPWWSVAIVSFIVSIVIPQKGAMAFLAGFFALVIMWGGYSWYISNLNEHILAHKISILILKMDQPYLLIFITGIIGGIVAGLAALAGSLIRKPTSLHNSSI